MKPSRYKRRGGYLRGSCSDTRHHRYCSQHHFSPNHKLEKRRSTGTESMCNEAVFTRIPRNIDLRVTDPDERAIYIAAQLSNPSFLSTLGGEMQQHATDNGSRGLPTMFLTQDRGFPLALSNAQQGNHTKSSRQEKPIECRVGRRKTSQVCDDVPYDSHPSTNTTAASLSTWNRSNAVSVRQGISIPFLS